MNPNVGLGTKAALSGAIGAWGAAIAASIDAGWQFYQDPGICSLLAIAVLATLGLFAGRSYQQGKIDEGRDASRWYDLAPDMPPDGALDVSAETSRPAVGGSYRPEG